uniref:Myo15a_0 protein n=2 Tax=Fopius arisanus TaxID=64838 RepID=A0A0C9R272_9HYME
MEHEISEAEGIFSRRMIANWEELPQTLRRNQTYRPDILSQFTDASECLESEFTDLSSGEKAPNFQKIVKRSELLRKYEIHEVKRDSSNHVWRNPQNKISSHEIPDRVKPNFPSMVIKTEYRSLCDPVRKTNSPDSLFFKSSDSESSDGGGHTDDSGAISDNQLPGYDGRSIKIGMNRISCQKSGKIQNNNESHNRNSSGCESRLDMNKNISHEVTTKKKDVYIKKLDGITGQIEKSHKHISLIQSSCKYENIPRVDLSKALSKNHSKSSQVQKRQPTVEELRMEIEHELTNGAKSPSSCDDDKNIQRANSSRRNSQDFRIDGFFYSIHDKNTSKSKIETMTQEKQSNNKLSVREILKRFEELRMNNQAQQQLEEKNADKTVVNLPETVGGINQVEQKPYMKIQHESHVSQISKSIQSQADHLNSHQNHSQSHNPSNHGNRENSQINRKVGHSVAALQTNASHPKNQRNSQHHNGQSTEWRQPEEINKSNEESFYESGPVINDGKHSLLQYAILNFRQSTEKFEMMKTADGSISGSLKVIESLKNKKKGKKAKGHHDGTEWTWKEQVDLVKFSQVPIEQSLLRLEGEMSSLAAECFLCLMRYMGDQPLPPNMSEVNCVYTILMHCRGYEPLRDEVYCQLMKQTTNNKSPNPDSCQRGWRLFSIVAAYFTCSEGLRPYLIKYLETAAYDKRRAYHGTATVCLQNLRKTVKYGGRKNVPSVEEIMAISAGRNAKRQIYRLSGGTERVINTKCTTVVQDVIEEMCSVISVRNPHEMDEFSLYCIVDGDAFTMPLARDEYVLDVTTGLHENHQVFYLLFCRSVWYYPLRLDAALYIEVVFNQIVPDYLEGLLLVIPGEHLSQEIIYDMAQIAALLHRIAEKPHEPTTKEIKYLLPKPALGLREPRPQKWGNMVQQAWNNIQENTSAICKAQVLEILSKWPLFGSSFFGVTRVPEPGKEKVGDHILALNRHGVHFIDSITHETLYHYPYSEVISTRKVKSEEGTLYLDMKCGNLMQQRITRLQTEQAHEISRLIRQYITMEQRTTNNQASSMAYGLR